MSFQHAVKIPKERIGVLIGKGGKVKQQIEERCGVKIEIDSETGDAMIIGNSSADRLEAFRAVEVITAISRGFSPQRAYLLFDDEELIFQQIDLHDYTGKSCRMIEELSGAYVSVYGHTVCLIGNFREIKLTTEAITMLAKGSMHKTVYNMLQGAKRKDKMDKMRLWEENPDEIKFSDS